MPSIALRASLAVGCLVVAAACGVADAPPTAPTPSSPTTPPAGGGNGGTTPPDLTITVTSAGVSPAELTVPVGARVTFRNLDVRAHDFSGGPDPAQPECPEIDQAGFVASGQSRQTGVFSVARTCRFHDHAYLGGPAFTGRIVIQ
ncbi:MAG: hypothetical protein IT181_00295 [Acidobacteria bacterium]|nr:hypothetical protein [Acidobacteriota bacterium]